jgi:hypothetical protein
MRGGGTAENIWRGNGLIAVMRPERTLRCVKYQSETARSEIAVNRIKSP